MKDIAYWKNELMQMSRSEYIDLLEAIHDFNDLNLDYETKEII